MPNLLGNALLNLEKGAAVHRFTAVMEPRRSVPGLAAVGELNVRLNCTSCSVRFNYRWRWRSDDIQLIEEQQDDDHRGNKADDHTVIGVDGGTVTSSRGDFILQSSVAHNPTGK